MSNRYKGFVISTGAALRIYFADCQTELKKLEGEEGEQFAAGYRLGMLRVITLIQQNAMGFDIPLEEIGIGDMEESDLWDDTSN